MTSLPFDGAPAADTFQFKVVSLKTLADSPLIAADHLRAFPLGGQRSAVMAVSAGLPASLDGPQDVIEYFRRMVAETEAVFEGPHYTHYNLQVSLGDAIDHYTLEHFESHASSTARRRCSESPSITGTPSYR